MVQLIYGVFCGVLISNLIVTLNAGETGPCAARLINGESTVCVCNNTYCDTLVTRKPGKGTFITYTSSKAGSRFKRAQGRLVTSNSTTCCSAKFVLDPETRYQTIQGFGGAVTDAAGLNWKSLSEKLQEHLIHAYYGDTGLEYNMIRLPIGGSDFSPRPYTYNDLPEDDKTLSNFSLAVEDHMYKIPMIKSIMKKSKTPVHILGTTWCPPIWMKSNKNFYGFSHLLLEYYQPYADYHLKFLQKYAEQGISVWGITTTNEPVNGLVPVARFNSLGWTPQHMAKFLTNNLGPTIRNSTFKDIKILALDDQRYSIPLWFDLMVNNFPKTLDYIDGVAVHYYGDIITPATVLTDLHNEHPDKFILGTEACAGSYPWESPKVLLGSWKRAQHYILDIIQDLNHYVEGWIDWNLCLDKHGGPNWANNFVDSPIIVFPENGEFVKQPMYYAMGHFSKFLPRGSRRIKEIEKDSFLLDHFYSVAFITPDNTVVLVVYNDDSSAQPAAVKLGSQQANILLEAKSVTTILLYYKNSVKK